MIYFISDQHFGHHAIVKYSHRPFNNIYEMEKKMIDAWNQVVNEDDTVYILGDFSFAKSDEWIEIMSKLKGSIIFIKGNHDRRWVCDDMLKHGLIKELHLGRSTLVVDGLTLILSHKPIVIEGQKDTYNIHGHLHLEESEYSYQINIGVDSIFTKSLNNSFGTPVSMDDIIKEINIKKRITDEKN